MPEYFTLSKGNVQLASEPSIVRVLKNYDRGILTGSEAINKLVDEILRSCLSDPTHPESVQEAFKVARQLMGPMD